MSDTPLPTALYVVGTPIGNLEDMTFRAVRILQSVQAIAAEDTRRTGKLLQHFQITTPQISYHNHNRQGRLPTLLAWLQQGQAIALVTDAGMPGIADPGYELVQGCIEAGILVVPIPGPSAVITALCAGGLPTDRFVFEGFLPAKTKARQDRLAHLSTEARTLVCYESPHRLLATLQDLAQSFGPERSLVLARELTKRHETFWRGSIRGAIAYYNQHSPQGEFTLLIGGTPEVKTSPSEVALKTELQQLLAQGWSRSQASRHLAQQTTLRRQRIYQLALTLPDPESTP